MKAIAYMRKSSRRDFVEACANFYIKELNLVSSRYELGIISQVGLLKTDGFNGGVLQNESKSVTIVLDSRLPMDQLMITLAHEMIHVKQIAKGRLRSQIIDGKPVHFWKGKAMNVSYYDRPWEHEAWRQERELAYRLQSIV